MKTGDIVFVRGHSFISKAVRLFDRGDFSHVAVALSDTHIIEAQYNSKVSIRPLAYDNIEVLPMKLNVFQENKIKTLAINSTGKWYDYLQVLGFIFFKNKHIGSPKRYICSELVHALLEGVGIDVGDEFTTPNQLYQLLLKRSAQAK